MLSYRQRRGPALIQVSAIVVVSNQGIALAAQICSQSLLHCLEQCIDKRFSRIRSLIFRRELRPLDQSFA